MTTQQLTNSCVFEQWFTEHFGHPKNNPDVHKALAECVGAGDCIVVRHNAWLFEDFRHVEYGQGGTGTVYINTHR